MSGARRRGLVAALLAAAAGAACGPAKAGDPCRSGFECADARTALECRTGTWTALPCRGDGGCAQSASAVSCDMSANLAGDACPLDKENDGLCGPGGLSMLQCRAGTLVTTSACRICAVASGTVLCTP